MSEQESSKDESKPRSVSRRVINDVMILQLVEGAEPFEKGQTWSRQIFASLASATRT